MVEYRVLQPSVEALKKAGLSEHIQLVQGDIVMNTHNNRLSHVNKRCRVMFNKYLPKYYRILSLSADSKWVPYTPGYEKNEADFLNVVSDDARDAFVHKEFTEEQQKTLKIQGRLAVNSLERNHRIANLKEKRSNSFSTTLPDKLRTYYTTNVPIPNLSATANAQLQKSMDKIEDYFNYKWNKTPKIQTTMMSPRNLHNMDAQREQRSM